jgi:O-antigen/teichoic acid export membrane protein
MSGPRHTVASAAAVSLAGGVVGAAANLFLAVLIGRGLGTDSAGSFFQMLAFVTIVSNILELGADTGLVRFVSAAAALGQRDRVRGLVVTALVPVLVTAVVTTAIGWLAAPWLTVLTSGGRGWTALLVMASGIAALLAVVLGAVRALASAAPYTLVQNVGLPLTRLAAVAVCVSVGISAWRPAAVAWLAPLPIALLAAIALLCRAEPLRRAGRGGASTLSGAEKRQFWAFSGPRAVSAAAEIGLEWADVLIVGAMCSPAEAGIYAVVTRAARAAELVQQASRVAVGPILGAALARGHHDQVRRIHADVSIGMVLLSWPFFAVAAYFAPQLLGLFGEEFSAGSGALRILCAGLALSYAAGSVQSILLMGGRSSAQLGNKVSCLAANVVLNLVLVPRDGIRGAALAWSICLVADAALAWLQIARGLHLTLRVRPALLTGAVAGGLALSVCAAADAVVGVPGSGSSAARSLIAPAAAAVVVALASAALGLASLRRARSMTPGGRA